MIELRYGDMVIDIEAKECTPAEAEELLNYLYRYYHDRQRGEGEAVEMVTRMQEWGFAGFLDVIEIILNSDEMAGRVRREFDEVWGRYFSHLPEHSTRRQWERRLSRGRAKTKEALEKECAKVRSELAQALTLINHDYLGAQRILEAAIASGIADWFFYHHLGLALYRQEKYLDAMPHYREAIERSPDDDWPWSCNDLKGCYEYSGLPDRFERGLEYFKTILDRFPNRWVAYHECGWMCLQLGILQEAHDYYVMALELCRDPSWGWTADDLRHVFEQRGKIDEALPFFVDLTAIEPYSEDWGAWRARAYVEWKTGDAQCAVLSFERSIELHRKYWRADGQYWTLIHYGWCLKDLGRYDEALDRFKRAKALDLSIWDGWHGVGWALKMHQDFAGAKMHLKEALRLDPLAAWSWFELGTVYQSIGSDPRNLIYAWEANEKTFVVGASNESACTAAHEAKAQLEENGTPWKPLRRFIENAYNLEELRTLCFELGIEYDNLVGGKSPRIVQLVEFCQRHSGKTVALIQQLHEERPNEFPPLVAINPPLI